MGKVAKSDNKVNKRPPALTIEGRENQLISKAVDEAEKRIESGKASDSLLIHYLKLGTTRAQYEKEKLIAEAELAKAKSESIKEASLHNELYAEAIRMFGIYTGESDSDEE